MLVERQYDELGKYVCVEFRNVEKELLTWLEEVIAENNCRVEKKEWKSKYNSYVIYDYEPFCSDGFEISLWVSSNSHQYLNFVRYLYDCKLQTIEYLNSCVSN